MKTCGYYLSYAKRLENILHVDCLRKAGPVLTKYMLNLLYLLNLVRFVYIVCFVKDCRMYLLLQCDRKRGWRQFIDF